MDMESVEYTKKLSLKKLCRVIARRNDDFYTVNIKKLIDVMMEWPIEDQIIFQQYFFQNKGYKEIEVKSMYKRKKSIKKSIDLITFNEDIFKK